MILVTGATGFIGTAVVAALTTRSVRCLGRRPPSQDHMDFIYGELDAISDYTAALKNIDIILHVASVAHRNKKNDHSSPNEYHDVNVEGTLNLAKQAAIAGVRKFIFISSIGVNGGHDRHKSFRYDDKPSPWDDYTQSKYKAEVGLWEIQKATGMEIVIIRPPLVYGGDAPGNFGKLIKAVKEEKWLPLGSIANRRSFVALDNLVDLIITCIDHPKAANQIFLVSDDHDVSTTELLQKMAIAFGKKSRLIPIPMSWIRIVASILGKKSVADRICGSLQVDITHTKQTLGWTPPVTMEQQLAKIAASFSQTSSDK